MIDEEQMIKKNKIIITIAILFLIITSVIYILLNSTINDTLCFHYIHNQNTGEQIGLITSILLYLIFWWFIGLIPSSGVFLFSLCLYYFFHRKDKRLFERSYQPKYKEEIYYAWTVAYRATYIAILILMALHISNIATINMF